MSLTEKRKQAAAYREATRIVETQKPEKEQFDIVCNNGTRGKKYRRAEPSAGELLFWEKMCLILKNQKMPALNPANLPLPKPDLPVGFGLVVFATQKLRLKHGNSAFHGT